jgi:serine/threonine protein kinase
MATVLLAEDERLGRQVAIKRLHAESPEDTARRFRREARLGASLNHPNLVSVYDIVSDDEGVLIVMEYVDGETLRDAVGRGPLPPERAIEVLRGLAAGLDYAHAEGIVHRDVKPANVLVANAAPLHAFLTDFGLTKRASSQSGLTRTGLFVGTIDYAAPEQIKGWPVDARADVYSLGCLLFEMLTGRPPFRRENEYATMYAHMTEAPPLATSAAPDLPAALDAVIERALAKEPDGRFPSAGDLGRAALAAVAGHAPAMPETSVATGRAAPAGEPRDGAPGPSLPAAPPPEPSHPTAPLPEPSMAPVPAPLPGPSDQTAPLPGPSVALPPAPPPPAPKRPSPWPVVILAVAAIAIGAAIAVVLATRGGAGKAGSSATTTQVSRGTNGGGANGGAGGETPTDPAVANATGSIASILDLSSQGRAATAAGDWQAAIDNRHQVLDELTALTVPPALQQSQTVLRDAIQASLAADMVHRACGGCGTQPEDVQATTLKRRFVRLFNPFAEQNLQRTFAESDF